MKKRKYTYYEEINNALSSYENHKSWHEHDMYWICDRIDWCWKFRKITEEQMTELTDRVCDYLDN